MLIRHANISLPTEQDIMATFESFQKANPSLNASKISEAKDSLIPFLGLCFGVFDVYQVLLLAIEIEAKQNDYLAGIAALETESTMLTASLETAKQDHASLMSDMAKELVFKKTTFRNQIAILEADVADLENQKLNLSKSLDEQKTKYQDEIAEIQAITEKKLAAIQEEVAKTEEKLTKTQKAFDALKAKLA
jgi:hypothetical protein